MMSNPSDQQAGDAPPPCVEHGIWTPLPTPPPRQLGAFTLRFKDVHPREVDRIKTTGAMSFHVVGCTGCFDDHAPQQSVARALAAQVREPGTVGSGDAMICRVSFLYQLGDVVYKDDNKLDEDRDDQREMYNTQFYQPYTRLWTPHLCHRGQP